MTKNKSSKSSQTDNKSAVGGRRLLEVGAVCAVLALAVGAVVIVDRLKIAREWMDYEDEYNSIGSSLFDAMIPPSEWPRK